MKSIIDLILLHSGRYPDFEEYIPNIKEAVALVSDRPDRCIENCKALFEGLSRTFILRLDGSIDRRKIGSLDFDKQVRRAIVELQKIETTDPSPLSEMMGFIKVLQTVRNKRGDVSHGRPAPKIDESEQRLAQYILQTTEINLYYMLQVFYSQSQILHDPEYTPLIQYEDNQEFNKWLDENRDIDDIVPEAVSLSKVYFKLFRNDYLNDLSNWNFAQEYDREELINDLSEEERRLFERGDLVISNPENILNRGFPTELYDRQNNNLDEEDDE